MLDKYSFPNDVNALIVLGIVPESKLFLNQRVCNDVSPPIVLGIVPTSELLSRSRVCNDFSPPIVLGIVPTSELPSRSRYRNDVNPPIVLGIVPPILLIQNDIHVMLPKLPIEDGNVPLNDDQMTLIDSTLQYVADPELESHVTPATKI